MLVLWFCGADCAVSLLFVVVSFGGVSGATVSGGLLHSSCPWHFLLLLLFSLRLYWRIFVSSPLPISLSFLDWFILIHFWLYLPIVILSVSPGRPSLGEFFIHCWSRGRIDLRRLQIDSFNVFRCDWCCELSVLSKVADLNIVFTNEFLLSELYGYLYKIIMACQLNSSFVPLCPFGSSYSVDLECDLALHSA